MAHSFADLTVNAKADRDRAKSRFVHLVILGACYSGKNSMMPNRHRPGMLKNPKARSFERDFLYQIKPEHRKELGSRKRPLRTIITIYYPSRRQDLSPELVYDLLQKGQVILNDRHIREKHEYAEVDKQNPRVEIWVEEIGN